jgi:hypothetical protein
MIALHKIILLTPQMIPVKNVTLPVENVMEYLQITVLAAKTPLSIYKTQLVRILVILDSIPILFKRNVYPVMTQIVLFVMLTLFNAQNANPHNFCTNYNAAHHALTVPLPITTQHLSYVMIVPQIALLVKAVHSLNVLVVSLLYF